MNCSGPVRDWTKHNSTRYGNNSNIESNRQEEVMVMMDQYKQETSQIHTPADLIRRTKEAMHEEEQRLQQTAVDRPFRMHSGKIYRWAMPVAAAATVLLLINVVVMVGNRVGKSAADMAMPAAIDNEAAYDTAADAAEESADFEMTAAAPAEQETGEGEMSGQDADLYESKQAETDSYDGAADTSANNYAFQDDIAEACKEDSMQEDAGQETVSGGTDAAAGGMEMAELSVMEVAETPAFVDNEDTECIMVHGIRVYVRREPDGQWIAYARMEQVHYTVTGGENITDAEDYAVKAYERLTKNADGVE